MSQELTVSIDALAAKLAAGGNDSVIPPVFVSASPLSPMERNTSVRVFYISERVWRSEAVPFL